LKGATSKPQVTAEQKMEISRLWAELARVTMERAIFHRQDDHDEDEYDSQNPAG
jgi:hypothetical protein